MSIEDLAEHPVIKAIMEGDADADEIIRSYDIYTSTADLEGSTAALVYNSGRRRHIVLKRCLSPEYKRKVIFHELYHILADLPRVPYIIGLDTQPYGMEKEADMFFKEVCEIYKNKRAGRDEENPAE